jgi:hypothetical protein
MSNDEGAYAFFSFDIRNSLFDIHHFFSYCYDNLPRQYIS